MKIIKFNISFLFLVLLFLLCGYIKNILVIMFIVFFHELGHIIVSRLFGFKIIDVTFYPFGGITHVDYKMIDYSYKNLLVYVAGIVMQVILFLIVNLLFKFGLVRLYIYDLFLFYNKLIIFFNILPIIPLDGYLVVNFFLRYFFEFKKAYILSFIISFAFMIVFFITCLVYKINNIILFVMFIYNMFLYIKNYKYVKLRLVLENKLYRTKLRFLARNN